MNRGGDNDVIQEEGGIDVLEFGPNIGPGSLFLDTDGNDLVIQLSDSDFVTISGFFRSTGSGLVEFFRFTDGTLLTADELLKRNSKAPPSSALRAMML
ncbi:MAG: calcium-binding protein [Gammaproteobacteria bacterium]|nr:calcium-binding protein [Gammaproteobacteria bacterium]